MNYEYEISENSPLEKEIKTKIQKIEEKQQKNIKEGWKQINLQKFHSQKNYAENNDYYPLPNKENHEIYIFVIKNKLFLNDFTDLIQTKLFDLDSYFPTHENITFDYRISCDHSLLAIVHSRGRKGIGYIF